MSKASGNRVKKLCVRFTAAEFSFIETRFKKSNRRRISDYIRDIVIHGRVTIKQRNVSFDSFIDEMVLLRKEINQLGNNFNQVVKKINGSKEWPDVKIWLPFAASMEQVLIEKVIEVKERLNKISEKWWQELK